MIGKRISNFHILEKIGATPNGLLFKARHANLGIPVALKFIHPEKMADEESRRRFAHEAHAAASLDHIAICRVFDYEEHEGSAFIAMDYLEGETLKDRIADGPLPVREAVLMVIQAAEGLEQAHARGVIHRDIKPSNLMATPADDGGFQVKILDFGVSRTMDTTQLTQTGSVLGTSTYMSPEQVKGEKVDHRTDLWSLGLVLYELLTGRPAFPGDHHLAVQYAIVQNQPESARSLRPEIPPELHAIIVKALKKDREARYQNAREMLDDLRAFYRSGGHEWSPTRQWLWKYRNRLVAGAGVLVALAIVGITIPRMVSRDAEVPNPFRMGQTRKVIHTVACESQPRLSPDGTRVLFTSDSAGNLDVYWMGMTGGEPVNLTGNPADDCDPCWMPDGHGILFFSERPEGVGIWMTDLTGSTLKFLVRDGTFPAVSPDGKRFAYTGVDSSGQGRIFIADFENPDKGIQVSLSGQGHWSHSSPAWSPDGTAIAYGSFHDLWEIDLVDGSTRPLTNEGVVDSQPVYSRDGEFVYFTSARDGAYALWRVERESGDILKMTPGSGPELHPDLDATGTRMVFSTESAEDNIIIHDRMNLTAETLDGPANDYMPNISADGRLMVFVSDRWNNQAELWAQPIEKGRPLGEPTRLIQQAGTVSQPVISPDGNWVAYYLINQKTKERDLWVAPIPTGPPVRITDHPAGEMSPAWSPDGTTLAYVSDRGGSQGIYTIPVEGGRPSGPERRVTPPELSTVFPIWSPDGKSIVFQAANDGYVDTMIIPADGSGPARFLTQQANTYVARWVWELDEIWVSGKWGGFRNEIRRLPLDGGSAVSLDPPLFLDPANENPLFHLDPTGRFVAFTEEKAKGDIWVLEAEEGVRF